MALNYHPYLLSSSPPGFESQFITTDYMFGRNAFKSYKQPGYDLQVQTLAEEVDAKLFVDDKQTKVDTNKHAVRIKKWEKSYSCGCLTRMKSCSRTGGGMGSKKVSFADEIGLALENIKEVTEAFDAPPCFSENLITKLGLDHPACFVDPLSFAFNFAQPAADYLEFRNKLETNKVSLEKVTAKDRKLIGTVRVKNISFEKTVTVRCSFDEWKSFVDFTTVYVPSGNSQYDTFSFEIGVPSQLVAGRKLHFAICFQVNNNEQYWDSNGGDNYEVECLASESEPEDGITFTVKRNDSWSDFAVWNGIDSTPYW